MFEEEKTAIELEQIGNKIAKTTRNNLYSCLMKFSP